MTEELHPYAARVLAEVVGRAQWEREFVDTVQDVFASVGPLLESSPRYEAERLLERIVEPDRVFSFRVTWTDDRQRVQVNRGWRVQFNGALGPYKGGTRFHASVNLDTLKALAFEQTFKNALTGLPLGSGKGGADFPARGRSEHEVMRFSQSYMTELFHHIGSDTDVPAGDIGVGTREIGYLFGQYRRLTRAFNVALTGKGLAWGGSRLRPEATGFGVAYFAEEMLKARGETLQGKTVAISGFGNVAWGVAKKVADLGGKTVTLSGPDGFIHDPDGVTGDKLDYMLALRLSGRDEVQPYAEKFGVDFHAGRRPWEVPCDVACPCAIQNELEEDDARNLVKNGVKFVVEGANMPTTREALRILRAAGVAYAPGKASNAGGVAVSGLEMTQNRSGQSWDAETVDRELHKIMVSIHTLCLSASERYGRPGDYVVGANIGAFAKVADAMLDQGVI
ncbi:MAG: NADP-specific glutamate dehydrogenase [Myxococcales bacterium]|nr:NADP-specific glutamate dehydrogenase [Myxococcales bacterium]MCB9583599.1 NADP-specific glutamate dehydrogenase [Polyangiaceae bacterium]